MSDENGLEPEEGADSRPVPTNKGMKLRKYDWPRLKQLYVEGSVSDDGERTYPSMRQLGEMEDVPENRIREMAAKQGWTTERAIFQSRIEQIRLERRAKELGAEQVELDKRALQAAKIGLQLVGARMGEIAKQFSARQKQAQEDGDDFGSPSLDARELETLGRAAAGWHALAEKALGEVPTTRTEIVGAGGGPVDVRSTVRAELTRDDPDRIAAFIVALDNSGAAGLLSGGPPALDAAGGEGSVGAGDDA